MNKSYSIGQIADIVELNIETIRYYERMNIIPKPKRSAGNQRVYGEKDISQLSYIRRSRELGFSLKEIMDLIALDDADDLTCNKVYLVATAHLKQVEAKISDLQKIAHILTNLTEKCSRGEKLDCPITQALYR